MLDRLMLDTQYGVDTIIINGATEKLALLIRVKSTSKLHKQLKEKGEKQTSQPYIYLQNQ